MCYIFYQVLCLYYVSYHSGGGRAVMAITRFPAAYTRDTISIVLSEKNTTSQALLSYVKIAILLEETSYWSFLDLTVMSILQNFTMK